MKLGLQIAFGVVQIIGLFEMLRQDVNGRPAEKPKGFRGVVLTLILFSCVILAGWCAGYYSTFLGEP